MDVCTQCGEWTETVTDEWLGEVCPVCARCMDEDESDAIARELRDMVVRQERDREVVP